MKALVMIMAGGKGTRLDPLCRDRCKPAVPFGGCFRVIDFVLSNFTNSGFFKINVLTQFKSDSLNRHIASGWRLSREMGHYIDVIPPQMRVSEDWYQGTADAIYQNLHLIENENPDFVFVFGGDHVYKMDVRRMLHYHIEQNADVTISAVPVPLHEAGEMGVLEVDPRNNITGFDEKPKNPKPMPGQKDMALVSMGNYIFKKDVLIDILEQDHYLGNSSHDFGKNILPGILEEYNLCAYDFAENQWLGMEEKERGYWRDIGTIDAYWRANMDLCSVTPRLNLYNDQWPIRTAMQYYPPAKFVFADEKAGRVGHATDSLISEGCIISGSHVNRSILSPGVRVNSYSYVTDSVLMEGVEIGRHCRIQKAIIDKDVFIPPNSVIGYDHENDRKHYDVTESGIIIIPKKVKIYLVESQMSLTLDQEEVFSE